MEFGYVPSCQGGRFESARALRRIRRVQGSSVRAQGAGQHEESVQLDVGKAVRHPHARLTGLFQISRGTARVRAKRRDIRLIVGTLPDLPSILQQNAGSHVQDQTVKKESSLFK